MKSRRTANVSVKGGESDEHRQTAVSKKREGRTTVMPQLRDESGHRGLHHCLAKRHTQRPLTQKAHQLLQTAHQLLQTACPQSSGSCSSSFPVSTSTRDSPTDSMSSPMGTASRFRVVVGLTSALLCHARFPTVDSPSQKHWSASFTLLVSSDFTSRFK